MKIVTPADNGPQAHQPGHGLDMHDSRRRHDALVRRVSYAREAGLIEAGLNLNSKGAVANAAHALVQTYQLGKVSRQQIEEEQRADETRLKGWQVAKPQPGTIHEDEIPRIKYRMAVRAKALAEIATLDLAVMIGSTGKTQKALPKTPSATPWRAGTGYTNSPAKRGKPIGLREYNHCHEPAGSKSGGQFSSGSDCGGGGAKEPPRGGSGGGNVAKDWSDYGYTGKAKMTSLRDRVKQIDPAKRLDYAEDRANRVMDFHDKEQANIGPKSATRQRQIGPSPPTGTIFRDEEPDYEPRSNDEEYERGLRSAMGDSDDNDVRSNDEEYEYGLRQAMGDRGSRSQRAGDEPPIHLKAENRGAANRALDAANNPVKDEGTSQDPSAWKNRAFRDEAPPYHEPGGVSFKPKAKLRGLLPDLGFTLSTDFGQVYNSLYKRTEKRTKHPPTARQMDAVVDEWAGYMRTLQANPGRGGTHAEMNAALTRALNRAAKQKKSDEYIAP